MIWGKWWRRLRRADDLEALETALQETVARFREESARADKLTGELEIERTRRIGAEALAGERRAEVDRLRDELSQARAVAEHIMGERLKSLDSLNIRLMEPRVEPPPPDLKQFSRPASPDLAHRIRAIHSHVDMELVKFAMARGKSGVKVGVPAGPVLSVEGE